MKPIIDVLKTEIPGAPGRFLDRAKGRAIRALKWSLKAAVVLAVLLAVLCAILSVVGGRQYEAELRKLKASGEPYTLVGLAGPPVPERENGAVIYQKVFKLLGIDKPHRRNNPIVVSSRALEAVLKEGNAVPTAAEWAEAQKVAPTYDYILPLVEKAVEMPQCKFPVKWQDGFSAVLSHCALLRALARILGGKAVVYAHEGKADAAIRCFRLCLQTGNAVKDEPAIISLLVRIAVCNTAARSLQGVLRDARLTPVQAKAAHDALAEVDLQPQYLLATKGERAFGLWMVAYIRRHGVGDLLAMTGETPSPGTAFVASLVERPVLYLDGVHSLRLMQKQIDIANLPYRELKRRGLTQWGHPTGIENLFALSRMMPAPSEQDRAYADTRLADFACGQAAMTLVAYKDQFGVYPATLDEASVKLGWKIPPDPFTDKSLIYKRRGKGFIVYSIGANLKDDNGVTKKKGGFGVDAGDIAWSLDH